jgi:hypothetical protein
VGREVSTGEWSHAANLRPEVQQHSPKMVTLLSSAWTVVLQSLPCSGIVLKVSWITTDCDLNHNFPVKRKYSGCMPRSASRATHHEKKFFARRTNVEQRRRHLPPFLEDTSRECVTWMCAEHRTYSTICNCAGAI